MDWPLVQCLQCSPALASGIPVSSPCSEGGLYHCFLLLCFPVLSLPVHPLLDKNQGVCANWKRKGAA